jgi:hypothetical protein
MAEQLYQITDEFPFQERVTTYHGLTLQQAAIRMDDLTGCGEDVILSDWDELCGRCKGVGRVAFGAGDKICPDCDGDGKWPGPWEHTDEETGREVTMTREAGMTVGVPVVGVGTCVRCGAAILGNNYRFRGADFGGGLVYEHFPSCPGLLPLCNPANRPGTLYERFYPMVTAYEAAHKEREEVLTRIRNIFDRLKLDGAPSFTPFTSESSAPALADAIREYQQPWGGDPATLRDALSAAETPEGSDYGDDTTPQVVISLAGLRRLESVFSELEQRREAEAAG